MAKTIMIQGTMSNAGKSIITAGLCRIFKEDGFKVAPFKAQNMALNSFITKDGLEMGRAQVVQAESAKIEPSVFMNPILLKPTNNEASQVIVNGEVWKDLSAKEYYKNKNQLVPHIEYAFKKLEEDYDIIVIEGAGSPAEINLKDEDIVNMFMAKLVNAPVLLVGDIDRGGVFASLIGTMSLFDDEEKKLLKGFIINKFRGDITILEKGLHQLEDMTDRKVFGVLPYLDIDIEDEDSLSERIKSNKDIGLINIAVIRIPRMSNFTDVMPFETFDFVNVKYVKKKEDLDNNIDMIIIPGSKNTMEDLKWMRENGIEAKITKLHKNGKVIFGICGGYQMLGSMIIDDANIESGGQMRGIDLLPMTTKFEREKMRTRVKGVFKNVKGVLSDLNDIEFEGYEIHMGQSETEVQEKMNIITRDDINYVEEGLSLDNVYGTYIHGIFDKDNVASTIISSLAKYKGIEDLKVNEFDMVKYKEEQFNILAKEMRKHLDMDKIYEIMGIKR